MDNILKLIVGCLGLVGLIVMIVPNSDPLASTKDGGEETATAAAPPIGTAGAPPPPPAPAPGPTPDGQANQSEFVVDDYDINNFGQPMVDPTPPARRALIAQQQQQNGTNNNQQPGAQANLGGPLNGGTESGGPAGPPPAPPVTAN